MVSRAAFILFTASLLAGCGSGGSTGTVTGKVMVQGVPLKGGMICFLPANSEGLPLAFPIAEDGSYTASGLPYGELLVGVLPPAPPNIMTEGTSKEALARTMTPGQSVSREDLAAVPLPPPPPESTIPTIEEKYQMPQSSGFTLTLDAPTKEYNVEIR